jgi:hypothetical protein
MDSEGKGCRQHFFAQPFFMPFGFFEWFFAIDDTVEDFSLSLAVHF